MSATTRSRTAILVLALLGPALLPGCDFFRPADPELPDPGVPFAVDYTDPDQTLETIRQAVENRSAAGAAEAYLGAFADSTINRDIPGFHQYFWPEDEAAYAGTAPADWNLRLEREFFNQKPRSLALLRTEPYRMTWEPDRDNPDDTGASPTTLHRRYTVFALGEGGDVAEIVALGFADLTLYQAANGNWYITKWEDRPDPVRYDPVLEQPTFGTRRLESQ